MVSQAFHNLTESQLWNMESVDVSCKVTAESLVCASDTTLIKVSVSLALAPSFQLN